jgi:hypothetical protein
MSSVDDDLINWSKILQDVLTDTKSLVKDLLEGINYILGAGIVIIALGLAILYYNLRYVQINDQLFYIGMIIGPGSNFLIGIINIRKYFMLREKYRNLYDLQRKINL